MAIYALADLHLALGIPDKSMEFFGGPWTSYVQKIEENWKSTISQNDLVLISGDISWAKGEKEALTDLQWIDQLPGTKLLLRGNHDYWWSSASRVKKMLPPSLHILQNNSFEWEGFSIGGSRLWDTYEYNFDGCIQIRENPRAKTLHTQENKEEQEKIFLRELHRLDLSLQTLKPGKKKIAMTHYPPIGPKNQPSRASFLLKKYGIETCIFGHLHNVKKEIPLFGHVDGIHYILTAADYLDFKPLQIL